MYHLLVKSGWDEHRDALPPERVFEYTEDSLKERFKVDGIVQSELVTMLPALFVNEKNGQEDQMARIGTISRVQLTSQNLTIEYNWYDSMPPIPNLLLRAFSDQLDIHKWEFSRTHWAIKNADLLKVVLRKEASGFPSPRVFKLDPWCAFERNLLSVMMPFDSHFDVVYKAIQAAALAANMRCLRADDIWEDETIIQDVVTLINKSNIIVCDCTGRNPNVFYEAGIAHALGRHVILITQSDADIPFDLKHLRYIKYLNNIFGRALLVDKLKRRIETLLTKQ